MNDSLVPPYAFEEFERRAARRRQQVVRQRRWTSGLACGAIVLVAAAVWTARLPLVSSPLRGAQPVAVGSAAASVSRSSGADLAAGPAAAQAQAMLEAIDVEPAVVRVGTGMALASLEDHIAYVDDMLSDAQFEGDSLSTIHHLRSQRLQLVDSLARVRYAQQVVAAVR